MFKQDKNDKVPVRQTEAWHDRQHRWAHNAKLGTLRFFRVHVARWAEQQSSVQAKELCQQITVLLDQLHENLRTYRVERNGTVSTIKSNLKE